ncbi:hypothetical protein ZIOFF_032887 [Zingiber officinale]|uniref:Uncharacterized protein n=1 Tax=Zingiber officinale TaxID=94328 RepID=A0A8J5GJ45_ZINOF|nr:hypothetical protein ZIOFF_032887 [Zingiber officinale]
MLVDHPPTKMLVPKIFYPFFFSGPLPRGNLTGRGFAGREVHDSCTERGCLICYLALRNILFSRLTKLPLPRLALRCCSDSVSRSVVSSSRCGAQSHPEMLVVVVAVKLPARLVRRTLQRSRAPSSRKKAPAIARQELVPAGDHPGEAFPARSPAEAMSELEKVMRANFYGAGFWRSLSQRERSSPKC